jgi:hypothetical protein
MWIVRKMNFDLHGELLTHSFQMKIVLVGFKSQIFLQNH